MLTLDLFEDYNKEPEFIQALRDFLPVALKVLDLDHVPRIKLKKELKDTHVPTFGRFTNDEQVVYCVINNRHPNDVLRTLAHEMAHYAQGKRDELDADSWHTGSPIENEANAQAGVIMREFNKKFPKYMSLKPIVVENCDAKNAVPELKAALTKRKTELKNADAKVAYDKIDKIMTRIAQTYNISGQELHDLWTERYGEIPDTWVLDESKETRQALSDQDFEFPQQGQYGYRQGYKGRGVLELADGRTGKIINLGEFGDFDDDYKPNQKWLRIVFTNPNMDDDAWAELEDMLWSENQVSENFADGKGPGRAGDSQRHGIPKGATISQLEKASHSAGRKGQLARWQLNMRRGHKK